MLLPDCPVPDNRIWGPQGRSAALTRQAGAASCCRSESQCPHRLPGCFWVKVWGGQSGPPELWRWVILLVVMLWCCFVIKEFVDNSGCGHLTFGDVTFTHVTALAVFMWGEGPAGPVCMSVHACMQKCVDTRSQRFMIKDFW